MSNLTDRQEQIIEQFTRVVSNMIPAADLREILRKRAAQAEEIVNDNTAALPTHLLAQGQLAAYRAIKADIDAIIAGRG